LLHLAKVAAGCETEPPPGETVVPECTNKVHGIRPSSLFTVVQTIIGVLAAPILPIFGAIVDSTCHRRLLGRACAILLVGLLVPQIAVNENTWFALSILFIVTFFVFMFQTVLAYSYLPELVESEENEATAESTMNEYTRNFTTITFTCLVFYLAIGVAIAGETGLQEDTVATARIGVSLACGVCLVFLVLAWYKLFQRAPPARSLPADQSIWTAGFRQLYTTIRKIGCQGVYRSLRWFLLAISVSDSAIQTLMPIMITLFSDQLAFEGMQIGKAVMAVMLASVPGGWISSVASKWQNPVVSTMLALLILIISTVVAATVLKGPDQKNLAYLFAALGGFSTSWKWTSDRMIVSLIVPRGQNAELMGLNVFRAPFWTGRLRSSSRL
jgi:MFS-type transporter involved in bile tolerance (Atg22 family)